MATFSALVSLRKVYISDGRTEVEVAHLVRSCNTHIVAVHPLHEVGQAQRVY